MADSFLATVFHPYPADKKCLSNVSFSPIRKVFQRGSEVCKNIDRVSNSFDADERQSYSESQMFTYVFTVTIDRLRVNEIDYIYYYL